MGKPRVARVPLICAYLPCQQPFAVVPSQATRAKYCSRACHNRANAEASHAKAVTTHPIVVCAYMPCSKLFPVKPYKLRKGYSGFYCSWHCQIQQLAIENTRPLAERFWEKVACGGPEDCWPWQAATWPNGYGNIWVPEREAKIGAHIVRWFLAHGRWPLPGMNICHSCDNPPCVNLNHLWEGTQSQNLVDAGTKGRMSHLETRPRGEQHWLHLHPEYAARGEKNGNSKLTDAQYKEVLALYATGSWTQTALANKFGIAQTTISRILKRKYLT